ncbi:MAG: APA family basic amino acid/polyamine antiporter [Candidatus Paceibacteria bacterium]|jgi:APA family basic amino acid/polyamine antiporter
MARPSEPPKRQIGLLQATGVGVGAIVGGGILALAGAAYAVTGPSAVLAFALNGVIALLTALSLAEMASKFPESGGAYTYARKVLSVEAAFTVGWVVWFASIGATALYAIGFAHFGLLMVRELWMAADNAPIAWMTAESSPRIGAIVVTLLLSVWLAYSRKGPSTWANVGKLLVFAVLLAGGAWALLNRPGVEVKDALQPFFANGHVGLFQAMGYSFIALQGFDLIVAVGGEVRDPAKNLPRAMVGSLLIALAIYLPLLLLVTVVGLPSGETIAEAARANPEGIVSIAARFFLGPFGYWLVIIAAVLSMFTAMQANLFAAGRIASTMARDRTLPKVMGRQHGKYGTPANATYFTALIVIGLLLLYPDVATAGAASSLIFLVTFAIAHLISILVRQRSSLRPPPFRTPWFPAVPVLGGLACLALALFQGIAVPAAGTVVMIWLGAGATLFLALFARDARVHDALKTAVEPELVTLRGNSPLVLVPISNPEFVEDMITLAHSLVPASVGRVLLQAVIVVPGDWDPERDPTPLDRMQALLPKLLKAATRAGVRAETLTTVAKDPMADIARVTRLHRCESVVLGLTELSGDSTGSPLELLLGTLDADVVIMRARPGWRLSKVKRILVPIGGGGGQENLLARLLGSLSRTAELEVTLLRVVPEGSSLKERKRIRRDLDQLSNDVHAGNSKGEVLASDTPVQCVADRAMDCDLVILGVQRIGRHKKVFGRFTRALADRSNCALIVMSRRG